MFDEYYYLIGGTWYARKELSSGKAVKASNSHYCTTKGDILKKTEYHGWVAVTKKERAELPPVPSELIQGGLFNASTYL